MGMRTVWLLLLLALGGCAGGRQAAVWDGRRGYDGNGDYGYDIAASRAEARSYRAVAAPAYAVPGTPDDPWGPYIREAATRFGLPERFRSQDALPRHRQPDHVLGVKGGRPTPTAPLFRR